jgi:nucleotide-binding universal stress UspA family protein
VTTTPATVGDIATLRVLIPVDGSTLSDAIVLHARRLVRHDRARTELHLLTVLDGAPPTEEERAAQSEEARAHLQLLSEALERDCASVRAHVVQGDPLAQILEATRSLRADLVAMTTHGRTGLARWVRGSVAERVLFASGVPVLLINPHAPATRAEAGYRRVIVPLDGSPGSAEILAVAGAIALGSSAQVVLLHVTPALPHALTPQAHAEALLGSARRSLEAAGIEDVRVVGRIGDPSTMILNEVEVQHGDLLAITTHARTGLARWRLGSVAEPVLRRATCPVLAYRMQGR